MWEQGGPRRRTRGPVSPLLQVLVLLLLRLLLLLWMLRPLPCPALGPQMGLLLLALTSSLALRPPGASRARALGISLILSDLGLDMGPE